MAEEAFTRLINMSDPILNYPLLLERFYNEEEVVREVIRVYTEKVENQLILIENLIKTNDFEKIQFEAHSIKGSSLNLTLNRLGETAKAMEHSARDKNPENIRQHLVIFKKDFELLKAEISRLS